MALVISANPSSTGYIKTGSAVGFPGTGGNRSFMFAAQVTLGELLGGTGNEITLWQSDTKTWSDYTGFPVINSSYVSGQQRVILQKVSAGYRLKVMLAVADNFPVLASYARTGVYLHHMTIYSDTFSLTDTATNHIMFRYLAFERDTTASGTNQNVNGLGTAVTSNTVTGFNSSTAGFDYTQAYVNGTDVWTTLNWTQSSSTNNLTSRSTEPWKYYSTDTAPTTYNRIRPYNQGSGSYFTGFNQSQLGGYASSAIALTLDEVWIGDWDSYTGTNAPGIANFWSGGYVYPTADGTLANGLRARIYYSSTQGSDFLTNLGSLGSAADLITRSGAGIALDAVVTAASVSALTCNAGLSVVGVATLSSAFVSTATSNKIIGVIVGRYFSEDYVEPGYVTDDTFNANSTLATTGTLFKGLVETLSAAFGLDSAANMLYGTDYGLELVVYSLVETESEETLAGEVLNAGTFTLTADSYVYQGGVAVLSSEFTFVLAPRFDHYGTADLAAAFSVAATGGFSGQIIDMADQVSVYTWDDPPTWENMNNGVWSVNGLLDQTQFTLTILAGLVQAGEATVVSQATLTTTATFVTFAAATLESYFSLISGSRIVKDAEVVNMAMVATVVATGLRTQEIAATMFGACELTTTAYVQWSTTVTLSATASAVTVGGVRWLTPAAVVQSAATMATVGGVRWLTPTAVLAAHAAILARGSLSKIDPYRRYKVAAEARTIQVSADNRTIMVSENTRVFYIAVPPIIQPTIERQQA